jgi:sugar (pentulose or hexulose) kinase
MKPICFISFMLAPASGRVYLTEPEKDTTPPITEKNLIIKEVYKFFFSPVFDKYWRWDWNELKTNFIIGLNEIAPLSREKKIAAISSVAICNEIAFLDANNQLLANPVCLSDEMLRSITFSGLEPIAIDKLLKRTGGVFDGDSALHRLYALRTMEPELPEKIKKILTMPDLLLTQFGANPSMDISSASLSQLLNLTTLQWDDEIMTACSVPADILPDLLKEPAATGKFIPPSDELDSLAGTPLISGMSNLISASLFDILASIEDDSFFVLLESDCYAGCIVKAPILTAKTMRSKIFPMALPDGRWAMLKTSPGLRIIYECCKEWKKNELDTDSILFEITGTPYKREGKLLDITHIPYWKPINTTAEIFAECVKSDIKIPPSPQKLVTLLLQSIAAKTASSLKQLASALHLQVKKDIMVCGEGMSYPAFTGRLSDIMHHDLNLLSSQAPIRGNVLAMLQALKKADRTSSL